MFNNFNPYAPQYGAQQPQMQPQPQAQPTSNVFVVDSLEEALSRFLLPNMITVFRMRDGSADIDVMTDRFGNKQHIVRKFSIEPSADKVAEGQATQYVSVSDLEKFKAEILAEIKGGKTE